MELPVIDLSRYLQVANRLSNSPKKLSGELKECEPWLGELCKEVSRILRETGALIVKDPRCSIEDNDRFLDLMEKYFEQPHDFKRLHEIPESHYQIGSSPDGLEVPRCVVDEKIQAKIKEMPENTQPTLPHGPDLKWRYMWRVGAPPLNTRFKEFNLEPPIPEGFPEWRDVMDTWGHKMVDAVHAVAELAAIGFGLSKDAFTSLMKEGPQLLGPTGSDLSEYTEEGTVFAGYHYDTNFLTIHGRSRFPGLNIWLRNGQKIDVKVPPGCLFIQAGKQIEWLTAGECMAGMHEVVVTPRTLEAVQKAKDQNHSLWRASSTLFSNIASDAMLEPLGRFAESALVKNYPPMFAGDFMQLELSAINLSGAAGA
ncbi:2-oxoglutarate (2OG) and Fe(II)-dependent oxygenase superfamily protein [Euphorbia peplus]|nr:2-oxoglutarate (2OG) and Fe(II)-dependent oxygenase superfamily protein [Euphorbia peplus]